MTGTRAAYEAEQVAYLRSKDEFAFEEETLAMIHVKGFADVLSALDLDVLALFGELDTNVDWRRARALYETTIGRNPDATLTVRTFPGCNHSLNQSETGSVREVEGTPIRAGTKCDGYYETQLEWLWDYVLDS